MKFKVTQSHITPRNPSKCGWCRSKIGEYHEEDCVSLWRVNTYDVYIDEVNTGRYVHRDPQSWDQDACEFHKNLGGWCVKNAFQQGTLDMGAGSALDGITTDFDCGCHRTEMKLVAMGIEVRCDS